MTHPAPSLFISHGSPMTGLLEEPYTEALQAWVKRYQKPKAIIVVSAHTVSGDDRSIEVSPASQPGIIHDFGGFPRELYQLRYDCPGSPEVAQQVAESAAQAGFRVKNVERPLDHGVWVPLRLMYPDADVPVVLVSLPWPGDPRRTLLLGKALSELRRQGVMLIGSGGAVHNLSELDWAGKHGPVRDWAKAFDHWVTQTMSERRVEDLLGFEDIAPQAERAHPTTEHFYPIFFSLGGSLPGDTLHWAHREIQYGTLSMLCFALENPQDGSALTPSLARAGDSVH
jgi:4,5-DOPA dioxygenase extradiol